MATKFTRSLAAVDTNQLQTDLNFSIDITATCITIKQVTQNAPVNINIEWNTDLSASEEAEMDAIILAHVPQQPEIPVNHLPLSGLDGKKLAVHPSYKPSGDDFTTYAVWAGAGDEVNASGILVDGGVIGGGPLLNLQMSASVTQVYKDVKFHPDNGRVWLHEAYIKFKNAGVGDYVTADIRAELTPLQTVVNLDLEISASSWITLATGGPGTGTHGWADATKIVLIPRTYSKDGNWDYDGVSLTPNASTTGGYKISSVERIIHRYVNKIPCYGDSPYFSITSDETTELPRNYYLRIFCENESGQSFALPWTLCVIMEIYRERTHNP